tara:strand:- start:232 stop:558 length:327 start_codon:yes stop_codon:yes gene_type:complete
MKMTRKNTFKSHIKDDLVKHYSFDYRTMPSPKDFAKIQAISGLKEDANEILDAIEQQYLNYTDGKKYLKAIIKLHNKLVYDVGGDNLLHLEEMLEEKNFSTLVYFNNK